MARRHALHRRRFRPRLRRQSTSTAADQRAPTSSEPNDVATVMDQAMMDHERHARHVPRRPYDDGGCLRPLPRDPRSLVARAGSPTPRPTKACMPCLACWALMLHGGLNFVYTSQSGRRGDDKAFVAGHFMGMAARDVSARDRVQVRLALSARSVHGASRLSAAAGKRRDRRRGCHADRSPAPARSVQRSVGVAVASL